MATSSDMQDEEEEMRTSKEEQPDSSCITSLQLAVVDSYRWRLEKRQRWKMYGFLLVLMKFVNSSITGLYVSMV